MKYFQLYEFDSPDAPGSGNRMNKDFLEMIDKARELSGIPWHITSGYRTPGHNTKVKGRASSSHLKGLAVDVRARSSVERYKILKAAILLGINRIGIGSTFIHLDVDPDKPKNVTWHYYE